MIKKLDFSKSKVLKLVNVLIYKLNIMDESLQLEAEIERIQAYIRSRGALQIGPLIQYENAYINEDSGVDLNINILLQCDNFIHSVEKPYRMESIIRVPNCMYCRYIGPEDKLSFAYQKIQLEAFENDIPLKGDSYTIFVDRNEEDETITADVFMERADE